MSGSSNWLEEQKDLLTRRFERGRDEVIEGIEKELKRSTLSSQTLSWGKN